MKPQIANMKRQSRSGGEFDCRKFISLLLVEIDKRYPRLKHDPENSTILLLNEVKRFLLKFQDEETARAYTLTRAIDFKDEIPTLLIKGLQTRQSSFLKNRRFFLENENLTTQQKKIRRKILNAEARKKKEKHPENWGRVGGALQGGAPGLGKRK